MIYLLSRINTNIDGATEHWFYSFDDDIFYGCFIGINGEYILYRILVDSQLYHSRKFECIIPDTLNLINDVGFWLHRGIHCKKELDKMFIKIFDNI